MIYLFGSKDKISVVFDGSTISEEQKNNSTIIDELPIPLVKEGFYSVLCVNEHTKEVYYEYREIKNEIIFEE
jgi:hypothetical protein